MMPNAAVIEGAARGSANFVGLSPNNQAEYDAMPQSEREKLNGRWLVENIPQITNPVLLEALEEMSETSENPND